MYNIRITTESLHCISYKIEQTLKWADLAPAVNHAICSEITHRLTLAAGWAVIPESWQAVLTVPASSPRAALAAVCERVTGGTEGSRGTFTPTATHTAAKSRITLLYMQN